MSTIATPETVVQRPFCPKCGAPAWKAGSYFTKTDNATHHKFQCSQKGCHHVWKTGESPRATRRAERLRATIESGGMEALKTEIRRLSKQILLAQRDRERCQLRLSLLEREKHKNVNANELVQ